MVNDNVPVERVLRSDATRVLSDTAVGHSARTGCPVRLLASALRALLERLQRLHPFSREIHFMVEDGPLLLLGRNKRGSLRYYVPEYRSVIMAGEEMMSSRI